MATQTIPTFEQAINSAATPVMRRRLITTLPLVPTRIRPSARRAVRKAQEQQRLLVEMLPLVRRVAFKIREHLPSHVDVDDLVANGVVGLVDAVSKFDSTKQVKLESYARHRIQGGILDGLRGSDPASRDLRRKHKQIQKLYRELEMKLGRPVKDEEIAAALGVDMAQWHATLSEIQCVGFDFGARTLTAGPTAKRPAAEPAALADDTANPFDLCYRREQHEVMGRALARLRERERQIISLYYQQELTMRQIAERLNVDESRISQLHSAALSHLKATVESILHPQRAGAEAPAPIAKAVGAAA